MTIRNYTYILNVLPELQFVYPVPKGSELIFPAPFRVGVNREKQLAD
jgi:hypothetical protein